MRRPVSKRTRCIVATVLAGLITVLLVVATVLLQPFWAVVQCSHESFFRAPPSLLEIPFLLAIAAVVHWYCIHREPGFGQGFLRPLVLVGNIWATVLLGCFGSFAIPKFAEVFTDFGADLPALTLAALAPQHLYWLIPGSVFLLLGLNLITPIRTRWFGWLWCLESCLVVVVLTAMYLPIFVLGCVVD